ncbi:MAG: hypothetical protein ACQEQV_09265 [Fibrobacterota bacterium]
MIKKNVLILLAAAALLFGAGDLIYRHKTYETDHFSIHYPEGFRAYALRVGQILEELHPVYRNKYNLVIPDQTDVIISRDSYNSWAAAVQNTISIGVENMDFNLRGTPDWFENVVAHEYAHIVSINSSFKLPRWMPYVQAGSFDHPNEQNTFEGMYIYPSEILPPWFFEGIAQYESTRQDGDTWDSHRDMILRTLIRSDSTLSWDHMSVFNGRADSYEKTYNHGFSLVKYIAETYGEEKIRAILTYSQKLGRLNFDRSIKDALGITGDSLYSQWKDDLGRRYENQVSQLGDTTTADTVFSRGFNTYYPRFSADDSLIYLLSNAGSSTFGQMLYRCRPEGFFNEEDSVRSQVISSQVRSQYDIHDSTAVFSSSSSVKSAKPHDEGGGRFSDLYEVKLRKDSGLSRIFSPVKDDMITEKMNLSAPSFSPGGDTIVASRYGNGRSTLAFIDRSTGKRLREIPRRSDTAVHIFSIFSTDWAKSGGRIAFDFMDRDHRKIGIYDVAADSLQVLSGAPADYRDPRFSDDGGHLYFSSDLSGIFNIYSISLGDGTVRRLTNVTSGAFSPDVNSRGTELTYAAYTADGYAAFLLDSITGYDLPDKAASLSLQGYGGTTDLLGAVDHSGSIQDYSRLPRRPLVIPSLIREEILTRDDNIYEGESAAKFGAVATLMDPLSWVNNGSSVTGFFLSESPFEQLRNTVLFNSYDLSENNKIAYDYGLFLETTLFPVDLSLSYFKRNIPTQSELVFNSTGEDRRDSTNISIKPSLLQFDVSRPLGNILTGSLFSSYLSQWSHLEIAGDESSSLYLKLKAGDIFRNGLLIAMNQRPYTEKSSISPYGIALRLQYDYSRGRFVDEERIFTVDNGKIESNLNSYRYHTVGGKLKFGTQSFLVQDFDTEINLGATYVHIPSGTQGVIDSLKANATSTDNYAGGFPEFFQPSLKLPGYAFSYRADSTLYELRDEYGKVTDSVWFNDDSVVVSDNIVLDGSLAYRFPLWPKKSIDKKLAFIYLDKLYGALNFGGALAAENYESLKKMSHEDILFYMGSEIRLKTIAFNAYPLALSFRWDRGLDRPAPVGGDRFSINLGFQFDNWSIITEPDGYAQFRSFNRFRPQ